MDYIRFVNSRDVREYLYSLHCQLTGEQKLFVIDNCHRLTLAEKLEALESLLREPDEQIRIRNSLFRRPVPGSGEGPYFRQEWQGEQAEVHEFASGLCGNYRLLSERLQEQEEPCCYELSVLQRWGNKPGRAVFTDEGRFTTCEAALEWYRHYYAEEKAQEEVLAVQVVKQDLRCGVRAGEERLTERKISARYDRKLNLISLSECGILSLKRRFYTTEGLIIYLPMPFKQGDPLAYCPERVYSGRLRGFAGQPLNAPFVVTAFNPDENITLGEDSVDICCEGLFVDSEGPLHLRPGHASHAYDLEYYRGELSDRQKILKIISLRHKGSESFGEDKLQLALGYIKAGEAREEALNGLRGAPLLEYAFADEEGQRCWLKETPDWYLSSFAGEILQLRSSLRIWLDDEQEAPYGYRHCRSVNEAKEKILECERNAVYIEELNLDDDLGEYAKDGGEAGRLIDFLCERQTLYPVVLHTANAEGRAKLQRRLDRLWPKSQRRQTGEDAG